MRQHRWYVDENTPITAETGAEEWLTLMEQAQANRHVALAVLARPMYTVSTVFLAMDHSHGDGPPILYETAVFAREPYVEQLRRAAKFKTYSDEMLSQIRKRDRRVPRRRKVINFTDLLMVRYATKAEAIAGHARIVAMVHANPNPKDWSF